MDNIFSKLNLSPEEFWSMPKDELVSLLVSIGIPKSEAISKPRGCWFSNITEYLDYSRPEDWDKWTTEQQYAYVKQHGYSPETMMPPSTSDSHKMFMDYKSPDWDNTTVHSDSERYYRHIIINGEYIIQNCRNAYYEKNG